MLVRASIAATEQTYGFGSISRSIYISWSALNNIGTIWKECTIGASRSIGRLAVQFPECLSTRYLSTPYYSRDGEEPEIVD